MTLMISQTARNIFILIIIFVLTFLTCFQIAQGQESIYVALVPPFLDPQQRNDWEGMLQLAHQEFIIFLYQDAAIVYSDAHFVNTGEDPLEIELGIPSTGFVVTDEQGTQEASNGILGVRLWVEGERALTEVIQVGNAEWYVVRPTFPPHRETNVKTLFWVQTSLTDVDSVPGLETVPIAPGKRSLLIPLNQAAVWKDVIHSIHVTVVAKNGVARPAAKFTAQPDTYDNVDSVYTWVHWDVEPSIFDDISIEYTTDRLQKTGLNTMKKLSKYIQETGYDKLMEYVDAKLENE
jgi:hypothetical protein